jgi:formamidopyrimidine-DNA glycosylase
MELVTLPRLICGCTIERVLVQNRGTCFCPR